MLHWPAGELSMAIVRLLQKLLAKRPASRATIYSKNVSMFCGVIVA